MISQPIVVPGGEHRSQSETHSMSVGNTSESFKTMTPPNVSRSLSNRINDSGYGTLPSKLEPVDQQLRRSSVQVQSATLPKLPSTESLSTSVNFTTAAPPLSPGLSTSMGEANQKTDNVSDKSFDSCKLTRKESYKAQRKNYRMEKKRFADELLSSFKDPTVIVMSDWLKVRGTLKSWTKLWCILKPGLLLLYKSPKAKSNHWVGTVLLNTCQVIERPSKKDGFCFKLFHPLEQSIWAPRGPEKEAIGAVVQPLPTSYLIFRAPSQAAGKCWLDALELSLRCSSLIVRSTSALPRTLPHDTTTTHETQWSEADYEKHFDEHDLDDISQPENGVTADAEISASDSESEGSAKEDQQEVINETPYAANEQEVLGAAGEVVTELQEEQKSLIWFLMKQVRPGMDLSKVVLPTFILEPRSFLEKLADSYYHADLLSQAVVEDDAFTRMKGVVKWYLSGFYKKPQGLKKPYNPLLGETFRCYWQHPNGSRTFYIAEQLSHHPPISGFYVTNRQDGFTISATIIAKSKFYGNSTSAVLDGVAILTMLPRGEDYTMTIPYAHCKGILMGTLSMELGGKIHINCEKTGYHTELEFKLKPFLGGAEQMNQVTGGIRLGKETLATISGYWDGQILITDKRTGQENVFFNPTPEVRKRRLKKYTVPLEHQGLWESEKLWYDVTQAINRDDQIAATEAKTQLEEAQRERAKERKLKGQEWVPKHFVQDIITGNWVYRHADVRPWDPRNDVVQYEQDYIVRTKTRHKTPIMRTGSIVSTEPQTQVPLLQAESRSSLSVLKSSKRQLSNNLAETAHDSGSSSAEVHSDSSQSIGKRKRSAARIIDVIKELERQMLEYGDKLNRIQHILEQLAIRQREQGDQYHSINMLKSFIDTILVIVIVFSVQYFVKIWTDESSGG
ncbi:oxysterol-binding protein-related protein 8 isoform X1 [Apis mellifera caucasica]|uniref:Oxysterol-binding protein n=1 Tax=Apis mellifera TaxID=7460 RepID=A0A7M7GQ47_APIME|nr:oxysterol-binding protein-related protein 8 isoform X1 [Apis mellifera]XP_006559747.1 oxysterol-binding protein-related protein 8 isoform X1 [Apis mellifera]XP_006559748.1 oxysterol-binding protein-related protein 8 isoform X1 [Apis mellifera]XP_006559749.1 oxysterol-binding protein-related protein 8 isoform X1 [Apis mellifera]XP_016766997.1 oxysterol-binding protein-related protein 8 isoform X1 [Apis mellifera]KAG6800096.1 oxysterol-binding protein-related protein 8 isoform X1 [Apis mellif|eukprot:XP_006559746.1 oxysterol-binding protein-related protein 8 isoform X1 [Apis mellifera]